MPRKSKSPFLEEASRGALPTPVGAAGDAGDAGALSTSPDAISLPVRGGGSQPEEPQYTVSPFRAMLEELPRTKRSNEHTPSAKTRRGVMYASGLGLSQEAIAKILGISIPTLRKHYEDELNAAIHLMANDIQTNLYNIARDPSHKGTVQAGIFLLSKLGGEMYREKKSLELSGPDGRPLQIDQRTQTVDPTLLTPDQRDAMREILLSAMRLAQPSAQIEGRSRDIDGQYEEVT